MVTGALESAGVGLCMSVVGAYEKCGEAKLSTSWEKIRVRWGGGIARLNAGTEDKKLLFFATQMSVLCAARVVSQPFHTLEVKIGFVGCS